MSVRYFESPDGTAWRVWDVIPGQVSDFRSSHGSHLPRELADGWLCFDCGNEKRRLAPLPPNWDERSEADLWFWCRAATPVRAVEQRRGRVAVPGAIAAPPAEAPPPPAGPTDPEDELAVA